MKLIDVGYGNRVNSERIVAVISADSAPAKRMVSAAKEKFTAIDATCGKRTKAVIVMDSGHIVMSAKELDALCAASEEKDRKKRSEEKG
ncbi:MAG: DUF370 domain-containing protein [Bacteroides sp.]|nr:DUF370 domain-containing protein [Eubacterium sp.]MCM1417953.1 DUF370 domain-containing protein [Roseburia sp.]MCM1461800.1 DUF370 domain-containing protein [Bacteroides sp.]